MSDYILAANGEMYSCDELYHYGVPGMKWGKRKAQTDVATTKAAYKQARKEYSRSYDRAYNRSIAGFSPIKKHREANDARWEDVVNKANKMTDAKKAYKQAKATAKAKKNAERALAKIEKQNKKDFIKTRSKEILKGESVANKIFDAYTGAHKIQAEMEYNMRNMKD